jgi:hypothetical protein
VLRDIIRPGAVELNKNVVHGMLQDLLDMLAYRVYGGREWMQRRGLVRRVAVDGETRSLS